MGMKDEEAQAQGKDVIVGDVVVDTAVVFVGALESTGGNEM